MNSCMQYNASLGTISFRTMITFKRSLIKMNFSMNINTTLPDWTVLAKLAVMWFVFVYFFMLFKGLNTHFQSKGCISMDFPVYYALHVVSQITQSYEFFKTRNTFFVFSFIFGMHQHHMCPKILRWHQAVSTKVEKSACLVEYFTTVDCKFYENKHSLKKIDFNKIYGNILPYKII